VAVRSQHRARLLASAQAWIREDPDPETRTQLELDIARGDIDVLSLLFDEPLRFGTSGIRGPLGAGAARMNVATVRRVSASLAAELASGERPASIVIGRDARHGSERFADEAAQVLSGAGLRVLRLPRPLPTPVLAFAVPELACSAGMMVTASHNPSCENGLKLYTREGAQIVAPFDQQIARRMGSLQNLRELPLGDGGELLDERVHESYLDRISALDCCRPAQAGATRQPRILYTPLHGVGAHTLEQAFTRAGRPPPQQYAPQTQPDPDFPTVERPNPEEAQALAPVLQAAAGSRSELVLANDPDADRLAAAIPSGEDGWRVLSGDEIGTLLADHVLRRRRGGAGGVLVSTVASSTLLAEIAHEAGVPYAQTLSGFKWVVRAPAALGDPDGLLFGYEEALGYGLGDVVRDKDGISAALALAACAEDAALEGSTLKARLEDLARRFGVHATAQISVTLEPGHARRGAAEVMHALRAQRPRELGGERVDCFEDLLEPSGPGSSPRTRADHARVPGLPPADVLMFGCAARTRVVVRPSGTEPRLKVYLQRVFPAGREVQDARLRARSELRRLEAEVRALLAQRTGAGS